ncbi:MAG: DNA-binding protein WhiA [Lachnospirales bacterium]
MSFSTDVKNELILMEESGRHCAISKLAAIINGCGSVKNDCVFIHNENNFVLEKFVDLIYNLFQVKLPVEDSSIIIKDIPLINKIINTTGVGLDDDMTKDYILSPMVVAKQCCKRAYLRGAFVCCGSIADPEKQYHLEFSSSDYDFIHTIRSVILDFGIDGKIIERKNHFVLYFKEGEQIVDMLNIMAAHKALLKVENLRIVKDMRNRVNRIVNCETANLNKVVEAAVKQIESIDYIISNRGMDYLPKPLMDIARLRLENPDASLKELGEMSNPKIGKSGVNHRLKKICDIADKLKGDT